MISFVFMDQLRKQSLDHALKLLTLSKRKQTGLQRLLQIAVLHLVQDHLLDLAISVLVYQLKQGL